jgi:hypothetical protein
VKAGLAQQEGLEHEFSVDRREAAFSRPDDFGFCFEFGSANCPSKP